MEHIKEVIKKAGAAVGLPIKSIFQINFLYATYYEGEMMNLNRSPRTNVHQCGAESNQLRRPFPKQQFAN